MSPLPSILTIICAVALFALATPASAQTYVYVNASTSNNAVWGFEVSPSGALAPLANSPFSTNGAGSNGGFFASRRITVSPNGFLYASNSSTIAAFSIDPTTGELTFHSLTTVPGGDGSGLGISLGITGDGQFLIAAGGSYISSYSIGNSGSLSLINSLSVPSPVDGLAVAANGQFAAFAMPVVNEVAIATIDTTGQIAWASGSPVVASLSVPTDAAIPCTSGRVYFGSVTNAVAGYSVDRNGLLTSLPGSPFSLGFNNQAVTITPDGLHLYASTGPSVDAWDVHSDGSLTAIFGAPFAVPYTARSVTTGSDNSFVFAGGDNGAAPLSMLINTTGAVSFAAVGSVAQALRPTSVISYPSQCGKPITATTTSLNAPNISFGADGIVTATVSANVGSNPPSGNISLTVDGGAVITQPLSNPVGTSASSVFTISTPSTGTHSLSTSYAAQNGFGASSATGSLTVDKAIPTITWQTPAAITYGTALSSIQLNAIADVAGTFDYTPAVGTVLSAGTQTLLAVFTPVDSADYSSAQANVSITVNPASQTITFGAIPNHTYGDPPFTISANSSSGLAVSFSASGNCTVSGNAVTVTGAGSCTITAAQSGDSNYLAAPKLQQSFNIAKATPILSWAAPASIVYGTPLSGVQLNAIASVSGTFTYSPGGGTVLTVGKYTLLATFTPADTADYTSGGAVTTSISVTQFPAVTTVTTSPYYSSQQYSDPVTFAATITPAAINGYAPAGSVTFYMGSQLLGTATLQSNGSGGLVGILTNVPLLEPTPFGVAPTGQMAPGSHTVTAVFNNINPNFAVTNPGNTMTINPEDAGVTYTGALFVGTACETCNTATVTLSATIQDISAVSGDPVYDAYPGDIRNAQVTFINRDTGAIIASNLPVGLVSSTDTRTGTATYNWNVNLGTQNSQSFSVGVIVNNYYTRNSSTDDAVITVSEPLTTISSNFNGTSIQAGNYIWFNANFKTSGIPASGATIFFNNSTISFTAGGTQFALPVPPAVITFSPSATCASTTFNTVTGKWETTVPVSGDDEIFLTGLAFKVPATISGGVNPVTWSGVFSTNGPSVSVQWKWGAAVYTSLPTSMGKVLYSSLGVKAGHQHDCNHNNGDHAGTPEDATVQSALVGGARGGGGSNFTGSFSGTAITDTLSNE